MNMSTRAPLIKVGQLFLNEGLNEYMIVTRNNQGQIAYAGQGFRGNLEDYDFIEKFPAVSPEDVDSAELAELLAHCPPNTEATVGFIGEGNADED